MNGGMGMTFTARDLASRKITGLRSNVRGLGSESEAVASRYEKSMGRIKRGAMAVGIAVVAFAALNSVTADFGRFQYELAGAGAVMNATAGEMRELESAAIQAGIATQFSPREAAQGLQALGAAGMSAAQSIQVLNPVLDMAAASLGQLGVAEAAQVVTGALNAFGMQASEAAFRVDQLVKITQKTNFQARDFSVAISQASAQAKTADQSFESMLATLGMLRNVNLDASSASTAYREAVRKLSGDMRSQKELAKLGIDVLDKQTNKIRNLGSIIAEMAPKMEKLNAKERNVTLTRIFGVRGLKTYAAFMAQYHKALKDGSVVVGDYAGVHDKLVGQLETATGAAAKNRDALLNTAEGQRILLKGSWETFRIMLGKLAVPVILPALKSLTGVLNVFIEAINAIPAPMRNMMASMAGGFMVIKALTGTVNMLRGAFGLLALGRVAAGIANVGDEAGKTATKMTLMQRETEKRGSAWAKNVRSWTSGLLGIAGIAIPVVMGISSYFRQKEKEQIDRINQLREAHVRATKAYSRATQMAKRHRSAVARSLLQQLKAGAKTEGAAIKVQNKIQAKHQDTVARTKIAYQEWLRLSETVGRADEQTVKARNAWVKLSREYEATLVGVQAAEAQLAQFRLKHEKDPLQREVLAMQIVLERENRIKTARQLASAQRIRDLETINTKRGKFRVAAQKWFDKQHKSRMRAINKQETALAKFAVKYGLVGKETLGLSQKGKRRQIRELTAKARPTAPPIEGQAGMDIAAMGGARAFEAIKAGILPPAMFKAGKKQFDAFAVSARNFLDSKGSVKMLADLNWQIDRLKEARFGVPGQPGRAPGVEAITAGMFGQDAEAPSKVNLFQPGKPVDFEAMVAADEGLGEELKRMYAEQVKATEATNRLAAKPTINNFFVDGKAVAKAMGDQDERSTTQEDGTADAADADS